MPKNSLLEPIESGNYVQYFLITASSLAQNNQTDLLHEYVDISKKEFGNSFKSIHLGDIQESDSGIFDIYGISSPYNKKINSKLLGSNIERIRGPLQNELAEKNIILKSGKNRIGLIHIVKRPKETDLDHLYEDSILTYLKQKSILNFKKVDSLVVLANFGSNCVGFARGDQISFTDFPKTQLYCDNDDPLLIFIKRLPFDRPKVIITTGERFAVGNIRDIPVIQIQNDSKKFHLLKLVFNGEYKELNKSLSVVTWPIQTCSYFYEIDTCEKGLGDSKETRSAQFLGHKIRSNTL